jgi:hypothetical protein
MDRTDDCNNKIEIFNPRRWCRSLNEIQFSKFEDRTRVWLKSQWNERFFSVNCASYRSPYGPRSYTRQVELLPD